MSVETGQNIPEGESKKWISQNELIDHAPESREGRGHTTGKERGFFFGGAVFSPLPAVERIFPFDSRVRPETVLHHRQRYIFAAGVQTPYGNSLDLASGTGYGVNILKHAGYDRARGIEIDKEAVEYAKSAFPNCEFEEGNIVTASYKPSRLVAFFEALEHLDTEEGVAVLEKTRKSLEDGGVFVVSSPRDIKADHNPHHKTQWSYETLRYALGALFTTVDMFGQDWDTAVINQKDAKTNDFHIAVCTVAHASLKPPRMYVIDSFQEKEQAINE